MLRIHLVIASSLWNLENDTERSASANNRLQRTVIRGIADAPPLNRNGFAASAFGRYFRSYSVVTIVVVSAFGLWSGMEAPRIEAGLATPWVGVKERIL